MWISIFETATSLFYKERVVQGMLNSNFSPSWTAERDPRKSTLLKALAHLNLYEGELVYRGKYVLSTARFPKFYSARELFLIGHRNRTVYQPTVQIFSTFHRDHLFFPEHLETSCKSLTASNLTKVALRLTWMIPLVWPRDGVLKRNCGIETGVT